MVVLVDDQHNRCRFPEWITTHHTWVSLDHHKTFKFAQKNATLKILDDETTRPIRIHQNFAQPQFAFQDLGEITRKRFSSSKSWNILLQDLNRKIRSRILRCGWFATEYGSSRIISRFKLSRMLRPDGKAFFWIILKYFSTSSALLLAAIVDTFVWCSTSETPT